MPATSVALGLWMLVCPTLPATASGQSFTCEFKSDVESIAPKIVYSQDDADYGVWSVQEPSGTFQAKSFISGHVIYLIEYNDHLDMGTMTMIYVNPDVEIAAVRASITYADLGKGGGPKPLAVSMKGACAFRKF